MKVNKVFKIMRKIMVIFFISLIGLVSLLAIVHNLMKMSEKEEYKAPGELVEIEGKKMHVAISGQGENTIVLLSGMGTASPYLDYEPFVKLLEKSYTVVVVEPFGYGFSDLTNRPRTVENITEEIHIALQKAGVEGPYILMPHSISGIYGMYYANHYKEEVKGFIGIDPTLPRQCEYFNEKLSEVPAILKYVSTIGIGRIAVMLKPYNFLPVAQKGLYSTENLEMTKRMTAWNLYNRNVIEEMNEINNNMEKTIHLSFPKEFPVLIFMKEASKTRMDSKKLNSFYQTYTKDLVKGEIQVLEGHHYLHWSNAELMKKKIDLFLEE